MKISIFGLGYVGTVNAVCLAREGHQICGVDISPLKVQLVNEGKSPITEESVEDMLVEQVHKGRIRATVIPMEAVSQSQMSIICVGTPSTSAGTIDLSQVKHVCTQIGTVLRHTTASHTVVLRSTMLPGSTQQMARLLADCSSRSLGQGLHVAFNPEFLREGTAVKDFYSPPYTIVGSEDSIAMSLLQEMYSFLSAPLFFVDTAEAEFIKYASNALHATKIAFANEIGRLARTWGIDGLRVMELLCQDKVLNISSAYLRPGFAYGGSCLPKDLRALVWKARANNVHVPLLESLSWSNQLQIDHAYELIIQAAQSKGNIIGFLGLAFKAGTDDLRESPMVEVVERLIGKGHRLLLYDENVSLARLLGTNKEFIEREIPHLAELLTDDINYIIKESKVLVVARQCAQYEKALQGTSRDTTIIRLEDMLNGRKEAQIALASPRAEKG
jgi:GDP-mannose 6-dehydrogenase